MLSSDVLELRRYYIKSIIDIIIFLASNELAFRGNWVKDEHVENGLFQSLFQFTLKKEKDLQRAIKIIPKNANYTSAVIQNELIDVAAQEVQKKIIKKVNDSPFITLLVDGTKDRNGLECLSIAARYICDGKPCESLLGLETSEDLTAVGLADVIWKSLETYGLDTTKIISQCYDGAAVMSGSTGGIQQIMQEKLGHPTPYVHCFSHRLHLALIELCSNVFLIQNFFETTQMLYKLFKHYRIKKLYEGTKLKKLIDTRWAGHYRSTVAVTENYDEIVKSLKQIKPGGDIKFDTTEIVTAEGILKCMNKLEFVYVMYFMRDILEIIKPADRILQEREKSYSTAIPVIQTVIDQIGSYRCDEKFEAIKSVASSKIAETDPQGQDRPLSVRNRRRSTHMNNFVITGTIGERDPVDMSVKSAFYEVIDIFTSELKRRFKENDKILKALSMVHNLSMEDINPLEDLKIIQMPSTQDLSVVKRHIDGLSSETKPKDS